MMGTKEDVRVIAQESMNCSLAQEGMSPLHPSVSVKMDL
jgi:hypothetical protein